MIVDPALIEACIKQDRKAQGKLYRACFQVLMGVCIRYHKNEEDAASVMNLGFLKILNHLDKRKSNVPFEAWIRRIMLNTIIDEFRKQKKHKETIHYTDFENKEAAYEAPLDLNEADRRFDAEAIEMLIRRLPPVSKQVFNLYAIDGYSHKEIGKLLDISVGTSKWHVSFARKQIKAWMAEAVKVFT